jgi:RNA polymerase sigma factor (sigma-70 family)
MGKTGDYSDAELVHALQQPKPPDSAIRHLYNAYFETSGGYVKQNSGSQQDAEDTFQEVVINFIELVQQQRFRGETSINNFLYSITRHIWLNELKRRRRAKNREEKYDREQDKTDPEMAAMIADQELREQLMGIIGGLGEACRKILVAFYYEGLSMREILGRMDYQNEQVLRNKKYKCMIQLEQTLAGNARLVEYLKSTLQ